MDTYTIRIFNNAHIYMGTSLYGTKLIRTNTEPLRNKRIFTELFIIKGAIFLITYSFYLIYNHLLSVISLAHCAKEL